ncbi:MAG: hypothetical protein KC931_05430 [Candidatus Omnitrophica bacterium]|nr:hypothetical protein [Candidatus Omnitrophota bacterium]MCA9446536.1 hypothetical protein [Candidatus Omnitrophota bacterium]MCB9767006.1 hypothetical protein [Candidatus Omnitrophota bacterium]
MTAQSDERRSGAQHDILAVSKDEPWLHFAKKILRKSDHVEILKNLNEIPALIEKGMRFDVLMISSELIPSKIKELEEVLAVAKADKVWALEEPHDEHQRINNKHLKKDLGVEVTDRPENSKAMRRVLKMIFNSEE